MGECAIIVFSPALVTSLHIPSLPFPLGATSGLSPLEIQELPWLPSMLVSLLPWETTASQGTGIHARRPGIG